jgi:uncharacterized membrane protein YdjX (TVP38/TMEM64 family)
MSRRRVSQVNKKWLAALVLILGVAAGVLLLYALVRLELIQQVTVLINKNTPTPLFLGLMLVLPMIGVPISVFIFVLGIKFGIGYGILLLAVIMPFHILGSYAIALGIRQPIRNFLVRRRNYHIPEIPEDKVAWFSFLFLILPVFPYAAKNYILPLAGVPFRYCFGLNWGVQGMLAVPFVVLGKSAADMNFWVFGITLAVVAVLFAILRRLRRRYETLQEEKDF